MEEISRSPARLKFDETIQCTMIEDMFRSSNSESYDPLRSNAIVPSDGQAFEREEGIAKLVVLQMSLTTCASLDPPRMRNGEENSSCNIVLPVSFFRRNLLEGYHR